MLSFPRERIKVLLLEGVHSRAIDCLESAGYVNVELRSQALKEEELIEALQDVHMIGIRSRTKLSKKVLESAPKLMAIGCFCIGTDQVDLAAAASVGIPVFNAPHSNTRSVAELVLGLCIMLFRNIFPKNEAAHGGKWLKSADGSFEVRGKTIGIVGYGHIGSQVSVLAENMGMQVLFYDTQAKLPLGNARVAPSLEGLLQESDIVTLHVPQSPDTHHLIGKEQINSMRAGSFLINASRGTVVDLESLKEGLDSQHIAGAALDVFPKEPANKTQEFISDLRGMSQVILTPHIGGSTQEAQQNIGAEVSRRLAQYSDCGSTEGAVNFPCLSLPQQRCAQRLLHIHRNEAGILKQVNEVLANQKVNVLGQYLLTNSQLGYVVLDTEQAVPEEAIDALQAIPGTIRTRALYLDTKEEETYV
ncbi:MAG: phosphoglycerate dehydrogenase [Waddliaceae bacterium]|nr:phosphoglycerate dehydrogenase [Waddliaceae bacterium]